MFRITSCRTESFAIEVKIWEVFSHSPLIFPFMGPDLSSESATAHGGTGPRGVGSSRLVLGRFLLSKIGVKNHQVSQGPNQG